jgi:hypothetical protein
MPRFAARTTAVDKRVVCPHCRTSYTLPFLGLHKHGTADKAIVKCVCDEDIEVSFVDEDDISVTPAGWQWHWNPFKWRVPATETRSRARNVKCQ